MDSLSKKRILLVIDSISGGGAELVVSNLCKHIDRSRFIVSTCALKKIGERGEELCQSGYDVNTLPASRYRIGKYLSAMKLKQLVNNRGIDLIHSHSTQGLIDGGIVKLLTKGLRHVHTFHFGNYPHLNAKARVIERIFAKLPDQLIAVGEEQKIAIKRTLELNESRIRTIWNGIEISNNKDDTEQTQASNREDRKVIIGSISTIIEQKGITYLLDAINMLSKRRRDFTLWIVGEGPLRHALEEKKTALGLDGLVEFKGWVHDAPVRIFPRIDIFVQSSLWEAMSMVVLEAMAAGKPVVVTDVGDNRHVIENEKDGIVVPKMDPQKMAQEIERLILDRDLRLALGQNARQKVIAKCSVQIMVSKYERLYLEVIGKES